MEEKLMLSKNQVVIDAVRAAYVQMPRALIGIGSAFLRWDFSAFTGNPNHVITLRALVGDIRPGGTDIERLQGAIERAWDYPLRSPVMVEKIIGWLAPEVMS